MKRTRILSAALGAALVAGACADPVPPTAPTPAVPTITETFSDTLSVAGTNVHRFTVQQIGGLKVTVTSIDPAAAINVGVGTPSSATGTCVVLNGLTTVAGQGAQISGTATATGNFCLSVSDVGNLVESVNYTIIVLHS